MTGPPGRALEKKSPLEPVSLGSRAQDPQLSQQPLQSDRAEGNADEAAIYLSASATWNWRSPGICSLNPRQAHDLPGKSENIGFARQPGAQSGLGGS